MRELLTTARNDSIAPLSLIQYFPDNPLLGEPSPKDQSIVNVDDDDDQHLFKAGSLVKGFLFCLVSRLEWEIECNGNFFHC